MAVRVRHNLEHESQVIFSPIPEGRELPDPPRLPSAIDWADDSARASVKIVVTFATLVARTLGLFIANVSSGPLRRHPFEEMT